MIKAITFDFWHTLYTEQPVDPDARRRGFQAQIHQMTGVLVTEERLEEAVKVAGEAWSQAWLTEHRTMGAREWLSTVMGSLELSLTEADMAAAVARTETALLDNPPILFTDAKAALPALSEQYRLAVISDTDLTPGRVLTQVLERDGIRQYFSRLTYSDEIGSSKPQTHNFLTTIQALNAKPHEAVHVGDMLRSDIVGAKGAGMHAIQYVGEHHDDTEVDVEPDAVITDHDELLGLLSGWGLRMGDG